MLDSEPSYLGVNCGCDFPLCPLDLCTLFFGSTNNVKRTPRQHASNRIEVRGKNIAAYPCGLERD